LLADSGGSSISYLRFRGGTQPSPLALAPYFAPPAHALPHRLTHQTTQVFTDEETDSAWHGGCLALAELARRGLLLPFRLPETVPVIVKAIHYDVRRGQNSVGAHVRDAACYVCWAFARAYHPEVMRPFVGDLSVGMLLAALFDREINCRRAASAAFQENVGRQGNENFQHGEWGASSEQRAKRAASRSLAAAKKRSERKRGYCRRLGLRASAVGAPPPRLLPWRSARAPNTKNAGIEILTAADYFTLGNRVNAYTTIALFVAGFDTYRRGIVDHLRAIKLCHWDQEIRELSSVGLGTLVPLDPAYFTESVVPDLVALVCDVDLLVRHGAVLGIAEVRCATSEASATTWKGVAREPSFGLPSAPLCRARVTPRFAPRPGKGLREDRRLGSPRRLFVALA
jgi:hypothetical protein